MPPPAPSPAVRLDFVTLALCFVTVATNAVSAPLRPFPQHQAYCEGSIRPTIAPAEMDRRVAEFYGAWKARYVRDGCGPGQAYVFYNLEHKADRKDAISCSEGHGYGMLLSVFMAGHDPRARQTFDALYAYFRAHPTGLHRDLMSWRQVKGCVERKGDNDSATDGDLDIALALLMADAQWGSSGPIAYRSEAQKVIAAIAVGDVNARIPILKLGDWASEASEVNDTRMSDFMPGHLDAFQRVSNDTVWPRLVDRGFAIIEYLQQHHAPATGLLPDFVRRCETEKPEPAPAKFLESRFDGQYGYNAARVPWRLGVHWLLTGDKRSKSVLDKLASFSRRAADGDPSHLRAGYWIATGKPLDEDDTSQAFNAPFAVAAMTGQEHQAWLNALWADLVSHGIEDDDYYGNSIKLLSMIVLSGNWWAP